MSRVIGGSSSHEAYSRMLDEVRQKRDEKQAQQNIQSERKKQYAIETSKISGVSGASQTSSNGYSGTLIDSYA